MIPVEIICCQCTTVPEQVTNLSGPSDQSQRNDWSISPVSVVFLNGILNILEYNSGKDVTDNSIIPMENIHGPILLISTEADTVWPSVEQAAFIEEYLRAHVFPYEIKSLTYENVSHFAIPMRNNAWLLKVLFRTERENPDECAAQRGDLSEQAVDFIQNHWN